MMSPMIKLATRLAVCVSIASLPACSDDDGANVPRNGPISTAGGAAGTGTGAGAGGAAAGAAGRGGGSSGAAGRAGSGGMSGMPGCPNGPPDAGVALDAGADASTDAGADAGDAGGPPAFVSFERDIHPIFAQRCGPCHVTNSSGGHNVGSADLDAAYADAVELGQTLVIMIDGGGMPPPEAEPPNNCAYGDGPGDPGCVPVAELELIKTWIAQCMPR
jgi:hypothetical protein